jgi:hypothetical protein
MKGKFSTIAIGSDGNPLFGFVDSRFGRDEDDIRVMIAVCADPACSSRTVNTIETTSPKTQIAIAIDDGVPLLAYKADGKLKIAQCLDSRCSEVFVNSISDVWTDPGGAWPRGVSMVIGNDGRPVVAFSDSVNLYSRLNVAVVNWH